MKTFSVAAAIKSADDEYVFQLLRKYCFQMGIQIQTVQINDRLVVNFSGKEQDLMELEDHLHKVKEGL
jgi:hypothetical protein